MEAVATTNNENEKKHEKCRPRTIPKWKWSKIEIYGTKEVTYFVNNERRGVFVTQGLKTIHQIIGGAIQGYGLDQRACVSDEVMDTVENVRYCRKHQQLFIFVPKICEFCKFAELEKEEFKNIGFKDKDLVTILINDNGYGTNRIRREETLGQIVIETLEEAGFEPSEIEKAIGMIWCSLWCEEHKRLFLYI